ncbi:MAG: signal peptidase I [Oscillospiraceae bacterium]|nr:signal peptidase I [Oscillospiraceae bacterium]
MIRTADILDTIFMSRVERNQSLYEDMFEENNRRTHKTAGRVLRAAGIALMVLVASACLSLIIPRLAGYEGYVVVSGSMEPTIPVGSLIYSQQTDPALLKTGDVIVFIDEARGTTPITHRVVTNDPSTGTTITKGDANQSEDINPVTYDNVVGKVAAHVPRIGFTVAMFTTVLGKIIAALLLLEGWLLNEIGRRLKLRD